VSLVPDLRIQICSPVMHPITSVPIPDSSPCQITTVWTCFINRILLTSCSPCSPTSFTICWLNIQSGMMPHSRIYSQRVASFPIVYSLNRFAFTCDSDWKTCTENSDRRWILKSTSLRVHPTMWHHSRLYTEPTDCKICWGTWWTTGEQYPINGTWWSRSRPRLFNMGLDLG